MKPLGAVAAPPVAALTDTEVVRRVREGDGALFEILMRRHNQRVYRVVRAVLKDEADAEDTMQQAYINAFTHLHQFEERSQFSTWLIRIALREAFGRRRKRRLSASRARLGSAVDDDCEEFMDTLTSPQADPERLAYAQEPHHVLEDAVDTLPETYRTVFMMRDIEGLSTSETGEGLGLGEEAVKTRLHRARAMIRRAVAVRIGDVASGTFQFHAPRCDRVVAAVLAAVEVDQFQVRTDQVLVGGNDVEAIESGRADCILEVSVPEHDVIQAWLVRVFGDTQTAGGVGGEGCRCWNRNRDVHACRAHGNHRTPLLRRRRPRHRGTEHSRASCA
jgi:RNA polymerase sigma-70 factor (ECF subfamily)